MNDQLERSASPAIVRIVRGVLRVALALLLLAPAQAHAINCYKNGCPGEGLCAKCCALTQQKCKGQAKACNCAYAATCPRTAGGGCNYCAGAKAPPCEGKPKSCKKTGCKGTGCSATTCATNTCRSAGGATPRPCAQGTRECMARPQCGPNVVTCPCCPNRACGPGVCSSSCLQDCGLNMGPMTNCHCCAECQMGALVIGVNPCGAQCTICCDAGAGVCPSDAGCAYRGQ